MKKIRSFPDGAGQLPKVSVQTTRVHHPRVHPGICRMNQEFFSCTLAERTRLTVYRKALSRPEYYVAGLKIDLSEIL